MTGVGVHIFATQVWLSNINWAPTFILIEAVHFWGTALPSSALCVLWPIFELVNVAELRARSIISTFASALAASQP